MNAGQIVWNQPHLMSKILYEFGGCITLSAIAFNEDYKDLKLKKLFFNIPEWSRYDLLSESYVFLPALEAEEECTWINPRICQEEFDDFQKKFNLKSNKREEMYNELFPNMIKNVEISNEETQKMYEKYNNIIFTEKIIVGH